MKKIRKVRTREIVLLALMIAITVCANIITAVTIPLYAGTAFVIISGIAFGPAAGVIVGLVARLISNMYLGQGIWTIWQMISWGILGGVAGISFKKADVSIYGKEDNKSKLFSKENELLRLIIIITISLITAYICFILFSDENESFFGWRIYMFCAVGLLIYSFFRKEKLKVENFTLAFFSFVAVFVIYGGVINIGAMVMSAAIPSSDSDISINTVKLLYITGAPFDILHALGSSITIFFIGKKIIRRIERIKIKYNLY